MRTAVIGLGTMGGAVAERLVASGFETLVYDISPQAVARAVEHGGVASTPEGLGAADVIVVSLPNDEIVTASVIDSGVLAFWSGRVLVELSTTLPRTVLAVAEAAAVHNVAVVDAPVSGGPNEARAGKLVELVGAEPAALERARPVLEVLGTVEHVGPVGTGKTVKLVNNQMAMGAIVVAAEAFTLGEKLGMDRDALFDVLSRSGGRSFHFLKRWPYVLADDYHARFAVSLAEKDLRLGLALAHDAEHPMPTGSMVHQVFEMARARGLGGEDCVAVIKIFQDWADQNRSEQSRPEPGH
ncbi:3-hydroxyisobutyrate dehydrogenase [Frankia canadensis]|uniref:3-hydroxyisobutyrate dehydrogenase n=1 Tax=Frankia canadensis TaxID=1836972 RepID=A0A2I2KV43_9ACTN|nr:NAD(P)-dependent oxidoreductase [Frankia canadensis]SNQ49528.1 3-hydroxyisobutyrate dehydrogenase [Frankia canadensis]SOU56818.1 3-hydroxyisobutyrate dehydrogenase [Frankia canadensis]